MISLDTETTGIDLHHGAKPFLVTTCNEDGENLWWEWDVDPSTREPFIPLKDKAAIRKLIWSSGDLVLQNPKFDVRGLAKIGIDAPWPWERTYDTLLAGHLLATNEQHDLTAMALTYLDVDIKPFEDSMRDAVVKARRMVQTKDRFKGWRIAKKGEPDMPSARGSTWKLDTWLPRAIAQELNYSDDHPWWTVTKLYANADSAVTLPLWKTQRELIEQKKLWRIYLERLKVVRITYEMEKRGVSISRKRLEELIEHFEAECENAERRCVNIAKSMDYDLSLPKSGLNKSLKEFCFGGKYLNLTNRPEVDYSLKTGAPSLDAETIEQLKLTLPPRSKHLHFLTALAEIRSRRTAISYMQGYKRFGIAINDEWAWLHPSFNQTGTITTRQSSSNPNGQNISKKKDFNLRYCFGPLPGREWWSFDGENMELVIPAYEAQEPDMIALFEDPDSPFGGSNHLLVFSILHPEKWAEHGKDCKTVYASSWYQWTKQGNFAIQYDAGDATADAAYRMPGARRILKARFNKQEALSRKYKKFADQHGYVETLPDKNVDPDRGFPIFCSRNKWGGVKATQPFSYHVQGTVGQWMQSAKIRSQALLDEWNQGKKSDDDRVFMVLEVHDELVFDFPVGNNLKRVEAIKAAMEKGGDDIGIPTKVSVKYHPQNYSEEVSKDEYENLSRKHVDCDEWTRPGKTKNGATHVNGQTAKASGRDSQQVPQQSRRKVPAGR